MKKLFIIDGNSLINRAFYALPLLASSNGVYSNAVFGFVNCLIKLIVEDNPDYFVVAFDHARKTFRNEIYADYKGTRKPTPTELLPQFDILKEILHAMGIKCIEQEGIEADDIIGTIAKCSGVENCIITGDRDSLQLISNTTKVWLTQKGITEIKEVNIENIKEYYGLQPWQVTDYKALAGDSSDNIPGIAGIGEKTAINLLNEFENIDNLYANLDSLKGKLREKIEQGKDLCYMSKQLATIKTDCNINFNLEECKFNLPFNHKVKELFEKYEFRNILKRTTLFDNTIKTQPSNQIKIVLNRDELLDILNNFDGDHFCFDARKNFTFCYKGQAYFVDKLNMGFLDDDSFYEFISRVVASVFQDSKITKIVPDLKANMHKLNTSNIVNVFDISLASYLISGGKRPDEFQDVSTFYDVFLAQKSQLKSFQLENLYYNIELPLEWVLYDMENEGFALNVNNLALLKESYSKELNSLEEEIKSYSSNENLNPKSPRQIAQLLFEELKLPDRFNKKHSTNVEALEGLKDMHPVVSLILRHRKVAKLFTGYVEPYQEMLKKSNNSIINTIFNQTLTSTGRLSSSEPNLQNIPVRDEEGKQLRKIFISRFDGGKLISADYNQIELRLLANFSQDDKLITDYNKGRDIHKLVASQIFGVELDEVTDIQRRMAKAVNFGIIYGISGFGLAKNTDMSVKDAKKYIDVYFEKYPGVKIYLDGLVSSAKTLGYAKTLYGRRRYIPELASYNALQRLLGERLAMNMPLQGSASDIIKIAMINVHNRFKNENIKSKLILQIHDELIVDTYPNEEEQVKQILIEEMQNAYKSKVPLIVVTGTGTTWYDCK